MIELARGLGVRYETQRKFKDGCGQSRSGSEKSGVLGTALLFSKESKPKKRTANS